MVTMLRQLFRSRHQDKKRDIFPFSIVRMPEKSSNIFDISIGVECLRIARVYNNQNSFLNSINPFVRRMISQRAKKCRITNVSFSNFQKTLK